MCLPMCVCVLTTAVKSTHPHRKGDRVGHRARLQGTQRIVMQHITRPRKKSLLHMNEASHECKDGGDGCANTQTGSGKGAILWDSTRNKGTG